MPLPWKLTSRFIVVHNQPPVVSLRTAHLKSLLAVCMGLYVSPVCPWGPPEQETRRAGVTPSSVSSHVTQTDCCINEAWPWLLKTTAGNTAKTWNLHRPHARMLDVNRFNTILWFEDMFWHVSDTLSCSAHVEDMGLNLASKIIVLFSSFFFSYI